MGTSSSRDVRLHETELPESYRNDFIIRVLHGSTNCKNLPFNLKNPNGVLSVKLTRSGGQGLNNRAGSLSVKSNEGTQVVNSNSLAKGSAVNISCDQSNAPIVFVKRPGSSAATIRQIFRDNITITLNNSNPKSWAISCLSPGEGEVS